MNKDKVDVPITEQSNQLTQNIDQQNSLGIVWQLFSSDCQIFDGTPPFPGFNDPSFIANMRRVSAELGKLRSMRLLNALLRSEDTGSSSTQSQMYTYLIAGGDKALFTSQEAPEDDPRLGATDLIQAAEGCSKVIYMGITCGLSAPYVAGQLNHCLRNLDIFTPILIGFNPSHLARKSEIKGWDKTFYDVAMEMENCSEAIILNPVVGPESITGSSRMKGGTATKIILDIVYLLHKNSDSTYKEHYRESLSLYQDACRHLYGKHSSDLSALIDIAAQSLLSGGRVVYCGRDTDGIIAMVDASECVPTYGSDRNDIRGYMPGGYINLGNMEGDISHSGPEFLIDWEDYVRDNGHQLDEKDVILSFDAAALGIPSLRQCKARKVFISVDNNHDAASWSDELLVETFSISSLPNQTDTDSATLYKQLLRCMYVKWVCNAISTGAHILKGKVYHNIMIDVRVSNRKLYQRAIGIITNLTQCTTEMAEFKLQSVVFEENVEKLRSLDMVIEKASSMNLVLPTSLLMILTNCSHSEAHLLLKQEPIVRKAIGKYCKSV